MELQIYGMGYNQSRPILSALIDDTVVFYEMFAYDNGIDGIIFNNFIIFKNIWLFVLNV